MNDFTFIILSTIDTKQSIYTREQRFNQTLQTFESIKKYAPGSKIVFTDNSINSLTDYERTIIKYHVDLYIDYSNNLFTKYVSLNLQGSDTGFKGINELMQLEYILPIVKNAGLINRRVFKMSGRYRLTENFSLNEYIGDNVDNKYIFKLTDWNYHYGDHVETKWWFDTRLWSFSGTLYQNFIDTMPIIFEYMLNNKTNLELSFTNCIPQDLILLKNALFVEGNMARGDYTLA